MSWSFDYFVDLEKMEWAPWVDGKLNIEYIPKDELDGIKNKAIESIFIPTPESAVLSIVTRLLVEHQHNIPFHGHEYSKTLTIQNLYENILPKKYGSRNLLIANCCGAVGILNVMRSLG